MADNAQSGGGIVVEIVAEVGAFLTGTQSARSSLDALGNKLDEAGNRLDRMNTKLTGTAEAMENAGRAARSGGGGMSNFSYQLQDTIVQLQSGTNAFTVLTQQGSQMAASFGPSGPLIGAIIALSGVLLQQLFPQLNDTKEKQKELQEATKQLADVFQIAANGAVVLAEKYEKLAAADEKAAKAELYASLANAKVQLQANQQAIEDSANTYTKWSANMDAAASQLNRLKQEGGDWRKTLDDFQEGHAGAIKGVSMLNHAIDQLANQFGITREESKNLTEALVDVQNDPSEEHFRALRAVLVQLGGAYDGQNSKLNTFIGKVSESIQQGIRHGEVLKMTTDLLHGKTVATEQDAQAADQAKDKLASYIERIKEEGEAAGKTARQKALLNAERLAENAKTTLSDADRKTINDSYDRIEAEANKKIAIRESAKEQRAAESAARKQANAEESVAEKLQKLKEKSELAAESTSEMSREQAILNAEQSLGKAATQAQIAQAGEYAAKIWDTTNALKQQREEQQALKSIGQLVAQNQVESGIDPMAQVNNELLEKQAVYQKYYDQGIIDEQMFADAKTAINDIAARKRLKIEQDAQQKQRDLLKGGMGEMASGFSELATIAEQSAGKSSGAYQAMFALSKGFSIAQATVSLYSAAMTAMNDPTAITPAQKFANYAAVFAAGVGLLSQIASVSMGGGRRAGGPVTGGSMYRVGEGNQPELFKAPNGNQYMIPGDSGRVVSNSQMNGGGQVVNFNIQTTGGISDETMARMAQMMKTISINTIKDQQRPNGLLQKSR